MEFEELIELLEDVKKIGDMMRDLHDKIGEICKGNVSNQELIELDGVDNHIIDAFKSNTDAFLKLTDIVEHKL